MASRRFAGAAVAETPPASVLDASALMAVLHAEDGASVVIEAIGRGAAVSVVDVVVADTAADLRSRSNALRMPDALILATAETDPDVDLVVTGDQQLTKVSGLRCKVRLLR